MANFKNYPIKAFSTDQKFLADDPNQVVRVTGQSMLDANIEAMKKSGKVVNSIDTLTEAIAGDYLSGIYLLVGGGVVTLDGDQAIYRVSDAGSGGIVMANGNELVLLFVANTPANIITPIDSVANIAGFTGSSDDQQISLKGWHPDSDVGGGTLYWDSSALKSTHDGVLFFSPTVPWSLATADYLAAVGETDPSGTGVWKLISGAIIFETKLTVGAGGNYATLNDAILSLADIKPAITLRPYQANFQSIVEIELLAGFIMAEQIILYGQDYGFIFITSVDAEVTISKTALTEPLRESPNVYPAFGASGSVLPVISALFNMDTSGTGDYRTGVLCTANSSVLVTSGAGVKNAGWRGMYITSGSRAVANETVWDGAGTVGQFQGGDPAYCVRMSSGGASLTLRASSCLNGVGYGVSVFQSGAAILERTDCSGAGLSGFIISGSQADMTSTVADNCDRGYEIIDASVASIESGSADGCARGLVMTQGAAVDAPSISCQNATDRGISIGGGQLNAPDAVVDGCSGSFPVIAEEGSYANLTRLSAISTTVNTRVVYITGGSKIVAPNSVITAAPGTAVICERGSEFIAENSDLSGALGTNGILVTRGSKAVLISANCQQGGAPAATDIVCSVASEVYATGATGGTTPAAKNTMTNSGFIIG